MASSDSAFAARRHMVRQRARPDPMSISSAADFRFGTAETVDAVAALDDPNITLYCLDSRRKEAIFVECDSHISLERYPFFYQGQFENAQRAIVMPIGVMHEVARRRGDRFQTAVMIHSVGRCGSTLLSKMFGEVANCLSLSEPDVYTQLLADQTPPSDIVQDLRSANRMYFQTGTDSSRTHLIVKFRSFCIELAREMETATPSAKSLFLYRDAESVVRSGLRVFCYSKAPLWWVDQLHKWVVTRPLLMIGLGWNRTIGNRMFPVLDRFTSWELSRMGAVGILAVAWLSAMERCVQLRASGMQLPAFRYDKLVAQPRESVERLIRHCQLPASAHQSMLSALNDDSQRDSVIARDRQRSIELSNHDRDTIRTVLSRSEIVDRADFEIDDSDIN